MDTLSAFAMGQANRGKTPKVFDWDRAAQLIKERGAESASAGLANDWESTGGPILRDGKPVDADDTYTYLASTWATPVLSIDGEHVDCWVHTDKWDSSTYWPESALKILAGE